MRRQGRQLMCSPGATAMSLPQLGCVACHRVAARVAAATACTHRERVEVLELQKEGSREARLSAETSSAVQCMVMLGASPHTRAARVRLIPCLLHLQGPAGASHSTLPYASPRTWLSATMAAAKHSVHGTRASWLSHAAPAHQHVGMGICTTVRRGAWAPRHWAPRQRCKLPVSPRQGHSCAAHRCRPSSRRQCWPGRRRPQRCRSARPPPAFKSATGSRVHSQA